MRLVVILFFITLVEAAPQVSLHQQEQKNVHHLNPINDAAAKEEAAKLQSKRTLLGATHYVPRHVGIHPLGFKYLLGYGPIGHYPYARPLSILRPTIHTGGWKPIIPAANVPFFKQIKPFLPFVPVKSHIHSHSTPPAQPVVNIQPSHPVQPAHHIQPVHPAQPVVPVAEPEAVVPVEKHVPQPLVPITPVHHFQQHVYPFYKQLINPLVQQPNLIQQVHHIQPHLIPQQHLIPQHHLVPQPQLVPRPHLLPQPNLVHQQHLVPQPHLVHQQHLVPQPHFVQQHFVPQPLVPQQHFAPQPNFVHQPHLVPQPHLIPQPQPFVPHAVRPLVPQPHVVQQNPVVAQVPLAQLPPALVHILKAFPQIPFYKNITPLYPINPPPAINPGPPQFVPAPDVPHPFGHPGESGVTIHFPQHIPEYPQQVPEQHIPQYPQNVPEQHIPHYPQNVPEQNIPYYPQNVPEQHIPQYPQNVPEQPQYPQNVPESPHLHPDTNSGQDVNRPDFSTSQHGQGETVFSPQPRPVHTHPQTPLYLPPHPVFRPGVANPVRPIEPTNSVQTEFSATYPKHHFVTGLQHPAISLEPPYGPAHVNINKH